MAAKKKKTSTLPVGNSESPGERFTRLANARVNTAIKRISLISNLASSGYTSSPEQREKIIDALSNAVSKVKDKFAGTKTAAEKFSL